MAMGSLSAMKSTGRKLSISTWNVAAINNNPFEYWITIKDNPGYEELMVNVENFLENPGPKDIPVAQVFTDQMFDSLEQKMLEVGWDPNRMVRQYWETDFKKRLLVSGFLKDPELGSKRLASMPDRITNTINVVGATEPVCRPTVINMYEGDLSSLDKWWEAWMVRMQQVVLYFVFTHHQNLCQCMQTRLNVIFLIFKSLFFSEIYVC